MLPGGDYLVPRLAGEPFVDRPPLVYCAAALSRQLAVAACSAARRGAPRRRPAAGADAALPCTHRRALRLATSAGCRCCCSSAPSACGIARTSCRRSIGLLAGIAIGQYGFALALRRPAGGRRVAGRGRRIRLPCARIAGTRAARADCASRCLLLRNLAHARAFALTLAVALAVALPLCLAMADRARACATARRLAAWWAAQSWTNFFAFAPRADARDPLVSCKNLLVVRVARAAARRVDAVDARPRLQRRARDPAVELPGMLALVMLARSAVMADPKLIDPCRCCCRLRCSARSRSTR